MRVTVIQMQIEHDSRARNQREACRWIEQAAELDPAPEVICLPARCDGTPLDDRCLVVTAAMCESFREVIAACGREMGVSLVLGYLERDGDQVHDSAVWCDADGDVRLCHRRITLEGDESARLTPGHSIQTEATLFGRVGVVVGADACAPTVVGSMRNMGAEVIFAPSCWHDAPSYQDRLCALAAEHHIWMVLANGVGTSGGNGRSRIIDPGGRTVCALADEQPALLNCNIQLENSRLC